MISAEFCFLYRVPGQSDHSWSSGSDSSSDSLYSTAMRRDKMVATSYPAGSRFFASSCSRCSWTFFSWIPEETIRTAARQTSHTNTEATADYLPVLPQEFRQLPFGGAHVLTSAYGCRQVTAGVVHWLPSFCHRGKRERDHIVGHGSRRGRRGGAVGARDDAGTTWKR